VISLAVVGGVGAAFAGCHPTGTAVADPVETAAFAVAFIVFASRASRETWLVLGVAAVLLSRGWLLVPAIVTIALAFSTAFAARSQRRVGAAIGALGVQVMLRWPPELFHGFPSLAAGAVAVVIAASAYRRSSGRTRHRALVTLGGLGVAAVVITLPAAIETLMARSSATAAESAAHAALSTIGVGSAAVTTHELRAAAAQSSQAATAFSGWYTLGARLVPIVAQQDRFLTDTTRSAAQATKVAAAQAPAIDYHRLSYHDGQISLGRLRAMERPMEILSRQLGLTDTELTAVDSPWLIGPLEERARSFKGDVGLASHGAGLAVQAARVLPAMLGGDGTRNYLIAFMTPSESRGYDGFIGSYGLLSATDGRVRLTVSGSITDIEDALPQGGAKLSGPSDFLARYGAFRPGEFPQDATYAPDLPTVSDVLSQIYRQTEGVRLDGVLALDPVGLAALLHFTGPIQVSGLPISLTQANAAQVLLTEQYTTFDAGTTEDVESPQDLERHDFLQGALRVAFDKLVSGSLPAPKELASVLDPAVVAGRISFWSFHKDEQPLLHRIGIDGSFPSADGGDLLSLTTQNTGNNKIDSYLHTSMADNVTYDPSNGVVRSSVIVHLANDAPASGLPPIVIDSPADPNLPAGTNRTWVTLYSPLALTSVSVDGRPGSASSGRELGVSAYSLYVDVPAHTTVSIRVSLSGVVAARTTLPMTVRLQPSANPETVAVTVTPTGPWRLTGTPGTAQWVLSPAMRQRRIFRFVQG
jgi:ABC-type transporter Mla MlaB component